MKLRRAIKKEEVKELESVIVEVKDGATVSHNDLLRQVIK